MVRKRSTVRFRQGARWIGVTPYTCGTRHRGGVAQLVEQTTHNRCVAGSSPAIATRQGLRRCCAQRGPVFHDLRSTRINVLPKAGIDVASSTDVRPKITLACEVCKHRNYITKKNRRNDPDRLELKKFCPNCGTHQSHRESK